MDSLRLRFLVPVALVSLCLASLCAFTAVSLFGQQKTLTAALRENLASRRAATELEECLRDLLALLRANVEAVSALHDRATVHIRSIRRQSDQTEERGLADRVEAAFARYLRLWQAIPRPGQPGDEDGVRRDGVRECARVLEGELLKACQAFEQYNDGRIEECTARNERQLRQVAWGLGGVGVLGGVAGLVLGYGVARWVSQSIRRLQVQIRAAAWKLDGLPDIVFTGEGDFSGLHDQVDRLSEAIETVVKRLRQREREVLRAEQLAAVGQLAAGVGHELRNPLTSIKMLVQTGLEDGNNGSDPAGLPPDDLRVIEAEVRRMERSLQTFLDFARPQGDPAGPADDLTDRLAPTDLSDVLEAVRNLVRGRAEKQGVRLELDHPAAGPTVSADGGQIQQVLVNLTLNGLDAMPQGGTLTLRARPTAENGGAEVVVSDTGPGIAPEMLERLFQPFASTKEAGLGLGLVISRRIAQDHGGSLTGENGPTGGATFTLRLPAAPTATRR